MISTNYCLNKKKLFKISLLLFLLSNKNPNRRRQKGADPAFEILQYLRVEGPWAVVTDQGPLRMRQKCCKNPSCGTESQGMWVYIYLSLYHIYTLYLKVVCSVPGLSLVGSTAVAATPISFCFSI